MFIKIDRKILTELESSYYVSAEVQTIYIRRYAFLMRVRIADKHFWQQHLLAPSFIIGIPSGIARVCGLYSSVRIIVAFVFLG